MGCRPAGDDAGPGRGGRSAEEGEEEEEEEVEEEESDDDEDDDDEEEEEEDDDDDDDDEAEKAPAATVGSNAERWPAGAIPTALAPAAPLSFWGPGSTLADECNAVSELPLSSWLTTSPSPRT
jgi:hypothetical protein